MSEFWRGVVCVLAAELLLVVSAALGLWLAKGEEDP
jgi:hypothetical protein